MSDKPHVSHSELETFQACEQRHKYAYVERLRPREKASTALTRGVTGHELLNVFFTSLQKTGDWGASLDAMQVESVNQLTQAYDKAAAVQAAIGAAGLLKAKRSEFSSWELLLVEQELRVDFGEYEFLFIPDLVARTPQGITVVDWKFVYNFYTDTMVNLMPQIPRYAGLLMALGYPVAAGTYGFVRYRATKAAAPEFRLHPIELPMPRIKAAADDVKILSADVMVRRSPEFRNPPHHAVRHQSKNTCEHCSFADLCTAELFGSDGATIRAVDFERKPDSGRRK